MQLVQRDERAVTAFTRSLALELAVDNVRANVVCPGDVATPLLEKQLQTYGGSINEMKIGILLCELPMRKK